MRGLGQGNGYEIRNGELVPCRETLLDGLAAAKERSERADGESEVLDEVTTGDDLLDCIPGTAEDEEVEPRIPTGLDI